MAGQPGFTAGKPGSKYKIGAKLGHGHFAVVREVTEKATGRKYAMKVLMKRDCKPAAGADVTADANSGDLDYLRREFEIGRDVSSRSDGVVRTIEAFEDEHRVYLILELAGGGNLAEYIDRRREAWREEVAEARGGGGEGQTLVAFEKMRETRRERMEVDAGWVLAELASAVANMHEAGVVHRDMKPENVMITEELRPGEWVSGLQGHVAAEKTKPQKGGFLKKLFNHSGATRKSPKIGPSASSGNLIAEASRKQQQVKIADFGLAERVAPGESGSARFVGSPAYVAPEVVQGCPAGFPADVWGLGIILYFMLSDGRLPFSGRSTALLLKSIRRANVDLNAPALVGASSEAKAVLARLLSADPTCRPTAAEVAEMSWVKEQVQKRATMISTPA